MSRRTLEAEQSFYESARVETEVDPDIRDVLEAHIVDINPAETGRRDLVKGLGDASVGAADVLIGRTDPPIEVVFADAARGKSKVLVGPNGAGKSTVFDAFMERGAHMETRSGRGAVVYGKPVHTRENLRLARLDQEELLSRVDDLPAGNVLEQAAAYFKEQFPIDWEDTDKYDANLKNQDARTRIEELTSQLLKFFNMECFLNTDVKNLSGGERTKLALFMVLLSEPDVLLLDEPTNHLDLRSIAKLTGLFEDYKAAGVSVLSVSHVDWFLQDAGKDGVMEIVWNKKEGRVLKDSRSPYAKYVKDPSRERVPIISGDVKWPQEGYGYKQGSTLITSPDKFTVSNSPLRDVSCSNIHGGEVVILSGDNGTGKTKLMEALIYGKGEGKPQKERGAQVAYLPQFWPEQVVKGTLQDFFFWVKERASPHSNGSSLHKDKPARNAFIELARDLNFGGASRIGEGWLNRPFSQFSGGEQRLLWFLAVSALRDIDMLALDEPTNHMDRDLQERITRAIQTFPGAIMLSTHDRALMTTLSKDAGNIKGRMRIPTHIVLERKGDVTKISVSGESPVVYMNRVMDQARRQAKRLSVV